MAAAAKPAFGAKHEAALAYSPQAVACQDALADGELKILDTDWALISDQFTEEEKEAIRARITIQILLPVRGWYLSLRRMQPDLAMKLTGALYRVGVLRKGGE